MGVDGNEYGGCVAYPGDDYGCAAAFLNERGKLTAMLYSHGVILTLLSIGWRKLRCFTEFTADQINVGSHKAREASNGTVNEMKPAHGTGAAQTTKIPFQA